ncbi:hypothetical protein A6D6_02188 [Alcanivorax xiamenensis]|uniref:Tetratricopeptide repeat-containing protein n=1 Tax=Alcanivorax xiamenensis TaxID=1177156 RepID=A0ABQ6Y8D0_9GAMM|nr:MULTISPECIES: hypothetical protein [Alcanivorax]KAF0805547.1 hypothetical protein A6D6_02188 [Alcanivorax xiamenensis]
MSVRREHALRLRGLIDGGVWQQTEDELQGLRRRYPGNAALCSIEGIYWARRGDWPRALCRFQRALVWDRDDANTVFNLGVTWCQLGAPLRGRLLMDYAEQLAHEQPRSVPITWRLPDPAPESFPSVVERAATRRVPGLVR